MSELQSSLGQVLGVQRAVIPHCLDELLTCSVPLLYERNGLSNETTPRMQLLCYLLLFSLKPSVPGFGGFKELVDLKEMDLLLNGERQRSLRIQELLL